jgi:hypothetical protein
MINGFGSMWYFANQTETVFFSFLVTGTGAGNVIPGNF